MNPPHADKPNRDYLQQVLAWLHAEKHKGTWAGIAERSHISYSTLEKLVKNKNPDPHWSTVHKLLLEMDEVRRVNALFEEDNGA